MDAVQVHHAPKGVKVQQADQTADAACEANEVTPVQTLQARRIYRLTERTIYKRGQQILLPECMLRAGAPGRCACTALRGGKTMSYCIRQARQTLKPGCTRPPKCANCVSKTKQCNSGDALERCLRFEETRVTNSGVSQEDKQAARQRVRHIGT